MKRPLEAFYMPFWTTGQTLMKIIKSRTRWHTVALTYILRWILAKAVRSVWECKCTASCGGELRTGDWPRYRGKLSLRQIFLGGTPGVSPTGHSSMNVQFTEKNRRRRTHDGPLSPTRGVMYSCQSTTLVINWKKKNRTLIWKQVHIF